MSEFEAPLSTTIDADASPSASGAGAQAISEPPEPVSARDDIEAAFKEDAEKTPEAQKKVEAATPKRDETTQAAQRDASGRFQVSAAKTAKEEPASAEPVVKDVAPAEQAGDDGAKHREPPKNFLPDSREVWRNVPRAVRRDIETMVKDHETVVAQHTESGQRYEAIKHFDDLARSNGRELSDSLNRVVELENLIQSNPLAGLNRILQDAGPRKADGQPFSLYEVADFIMKQGPEGYQNLVTQRQQQQQGPSEVDRLNERIAAMEAEAKAAPIINQFAAKNDRYYELESDIALFLQSGKVPASLSPEDRLAAAYDMAVRINPASNAQARPSTEGEDAERRAGEDFSGSRSIKSSPGSVTEEVEDQAKGGESILESIRKASRSLTRA